jgi:hypothetical protein
VKFKVDENLPSEFAGILREAAFDADTTEEEQLGGANDDVLSKTVQAETCAFDPGP